MRREFGLELEMSYRNEIIRVFVCMNKVNGDRLVGVGVLLVWGQSC